MGPWLWSCWRVLCPPDSAAAKDPSGVRVDPGVDAPGDADADTAEPGEARPIEPMVIGRAGDDDWSCRG
jgi:hypothetical protein